MDTKMRKLIGVLAAIVIAIAANASLATASSSSGFRATASSSGSRAAEIAAVTATWRKLELAMYFGPPGAVCSQMTAKGKKAFARGFGSCTLAARVRALTNHLCVLIGGFTGPDWRTKVIFDVGHFGYKILSPTKVRTFDPLGGNQILVKSSGKGRFDRGWPSSGC
jgi:hypothetical protein